MLHLPSRLEACLTVAAGVLIAVLCWYFGVDVWHSLLLGCAITVTALACRAAGLAPDARELSWRPGAEENRVGSRNDVASLASSLRAHWTHIGLTAEGRLNELARRRLALEELDLRNPGDGPAIERRIGTTAYRILARRRRARISLRTLTHTLDALDAIDSTHYPAPSAGSRRPFLDAVRFSLGRARER